MILTPAKPRGHASVSTQEVWESLGTGIPWLQQPRVSLVVAVSAGLARLRTHLHAPARGWGRQHQPSLDAIPCPPPATTAARRAVAHAGQPARTRERARKIDSLDRCPVNWGLYGALGAARSAWLPAGAPSPPASGTPSSPAPGTALPAGEPAGAKGGSRDGEKNETTVGTTHRGKI